MYKPVFAPGVCQIPKLLTITVLEKMGVKAGEVAWIADAACRGLRVRITNTSNAGRTVTFYYRYKDRNTRKLKPVAMGRYVSGAADKRAAGTLGLEEARHLVDQKLRPWAEEGTDVRRALKAERNADSNKSLRTVRGLIPDYLDYVARRGRAVGTIASYRRYLRPLAAWWGDKLPKDINRGDVEDLFDRVKKEGVPPIDIDGVTPMEGKGRTSGGHRAAGLTLSAGRAYWSYLVDREIAPYNPWQGQKKLSEESASGIAQRALDDDEIKRLLKGADRELNARDRTIVKLLLATGLRPNEVCAGEWKEINLKTGEWLIPGARMKYKKANHLVFLSDYALVLLKGWRKSQHGRHRYIFPSEGTVHPHAVADNLVGRCKALGVEAFSPKVCRASVRTGLQRIGCPEEVRSRISHHQRGDKVSRSYDHYSYDPEAKHWWQQWGLHLGLLERGLKK